MTLADRNRALVLEAMTALFQRKDPLAVERLYAPSYIQHNPCLSQGRNALARIVARLPAALCYEPGMTIAEGDYVAIHGRIRGWAVRTQVVVDIFRVEDGRIAEHWNVFQDEVPADAGKARVAMFSPDEAARQRLSPAAAQTAAEECEWILLENLVRVFGERDPERRQSAIAEIYAPGAGLYEPHCSAIGHDAINEAVETLLSNAPLEFAFTAIGPAVGHHGMARLRWAFGPAEGPAVVTGTDVARLAAGRIQTLYVFLDPAGA